MSEETSPRSTQPTAADVAIWLRQLNRTQIHDPGWITVNRRYHELARAIRPFINEHFSEEEREAAFDGFTAALMTLAHFEDIARLQSLFEAQPAKAPRRQNPTNLEPDSRPL
jgi:hypothetical protein